MYTVCTVTLNSSLPIEEPVSVSSEKKLAGTKNVREC